MFYLKLVLIIPMINVVIFFTIKNTKVYVSVVELPAKNKQKLSQILSKGFKRSMYWNECKKK